MALPFSLDSIIKRTEQINDTLDQDVLVNPKVFNQLKQDVQQISGKTLSTEDRQKLSYIQGQIQTIEATLALINNQRDDEKQSSLPIRPAHNTERDTQVNELYETFESLGFNDKCPLQLTEEMNQIANDLYTVVKKIRNKSTLPQSQQQKLATIMSRTKLLNQLSQGSVPARKPEEQKTAATTSQRAQRSTIRVDTNQYSDRRGASPSICTSCAVAGAQLLLNSAPVNKTLILRSISNGRTLHTNVATSTLQDPNTNFSCAEILGAKILPLKALVHAKPRFPTDATAQEEDYTTHIADQLLAHQNNEKTVAVLTKSPYSLLVAYIDQKFILMDTHGDTATRNGAFIETFATKKAFCEYLVEKFGFIDGPATDIWQAEFTEEEKAILEQEEGVDENTKAAIKLSKEQENPNTYGLTILAKADGRDRRQGASDSKSK